MAGIDSNTLFLLRGDSFSDSSYRNAIINRTGSMGDAQIVDEVIDGKEIKCIYFNTTGYFTANIDSTFLKRPFCIDWWEKDYGVTSNTSGASLLCNMLSSGNYSFGLSSWTSSRNCISMSTGGSSYNIANVTHIGATKLEEWVHRAIEFTGSAYNFYENGKLYGSITTTNTCYAPLDTWYFNRWRGTNGISNKKVFNFRISSCIRYGGEFEPNSDYYDENNCTDEIIDIETIDENATLYDILEKSLELNETYSELKLRLAKHLREKGVSVRNSEPFQSMISRVKEIEREGGVVLDVVGNISETGEDAINDFNLAVTYKLYDVVSEDASQLVNAPVTSGTLHGILKVYDTTHYILQVLETVEGETYKRILTTEWSKWKQGVSGGSGSGSGSGSDADLSNYYEKAEIDDMLSNYYDKEDVDTELSNYYNKEEVDTETKDIGSGEYRFHKHTIGSSTNSIITLSKLNELRPHHRFQALGFTLDDTNETYLVFVESTSLPVYNNVNASKNIFKLILNSGEKTIYKLVNNDWILEYEGKETYTFDFTVKLDVEKIFVCETSISGTISAIYGNRYITEKNFGFATGNAKDGRYRVVNCSDTPEKEGILEIISDLKFRKLFFYTKTKTYLKQIYLADDGVGSHVGSWNEIGNYSYSITNYYTKSETDKAISNAINAINIPSIDGLASKTYVDEAIANIDIPETDLTGLATESYVDEAISSIDIPSIDGLASEDFVREQINGINIPDISGLASKAELEAKAEEIVAQIPDLSNYTTIDTVQEMINTLIDAPRTELINDINDIIRGM